MRMISLRRDDAEGPAGSISRALGRAMSSISRHGCASSARSAKGDGDLLGLWSDGADVHMAVFDTTTSPASRIVTLECPQRSLSLGRRTCIRRPCGSSARSATSTAFGRRACPIARHWLDHGRWGVRHPGARPGAVRSVGRLLRFLAAEGAPLHQIPVGPVHAGIIEPGHFRFSANGEIVVRLEERLGYVHKGIEHLMAARRSDRAARLAGRVSGDSTVAYAFAFAQAVESALEHRGSAARGLSAGADGRTRAPRQSFRRHRRDLQRRRFRLMHAHCAILRERILERVNRVFRPSADDGLHHARRRRDGSDARRRRRAARADGRSRRNVSASIHPALRRHDVAAGSHGRHRHIASPISRTNMAAAASSAAPRAALSTRDARPAMRPIRNSPSRLGAASEGDVDARVWVRFDEIKAVARPHRADSRRVCRRSVARRKSTGCASEAREGVALVEGFRGDILVWVRIGATGTVRAMSSARSLLVPVAAARSGDRGQYRRGLPALQQIVQLLLFGARPLEGSAPCAIFSSRVCFARR